MSIWNNLGCKNCFVGVVSLGFFLLALPTNIYAAAAPTRLVIGYASTTPRLMPLWIARDQGFFAKYGVDRNRCSCAAARRCHRHGFRGHPDRAHGGRARSCRRWRRVMTSRCWRLSPAAILMTWSLAQISKRLKTCAAKNSPSIASAAAHGSAPCCGSNISASIRNATRSCFNPSAIRACSPRPWSPAPSIRFSSIASIVNC